MTLNGRLRAFRRCCVSIAMMPFVVGACTASNPSAGSSSSNPATASASASTSTPVTAGTMVTTPDGYQFWLSVTKQATTSPDLKVLQGVRLSDPKVCYRGYFGTQCPVLADAPPGKDYIFAVVTVTNKTDRAEPLLQLISGSLLFLLVPFGEFDQFEAWVRLDLFCADNAPHNPATTDPSTFCVPFTDLTPMSGTEPLYARSLCLGADLTVINQCELGPGQSTALYVFWGEPIPESAPTGDVHVYAYAKASTGQTVTPGFELIRIG